MNTTVTPSNAGAPDAGFVAPFVLVLAAVVLVGPSFALLFTFQSRQHLGADESALSSTAGPNNDIDAAGPRPPP